MCLDYQRCLVKRKCLSEYSYRLSLDNYGSKAGESVCNTGCGGTRSVQRVSMSVCVFTGVDAGWFADFDPDI